MTFPLYPLYKQSGNDWLGDIPSQWGVKRLKYLFNLMKRAITDEDEIVTCFRDGQVTLRRNRREDGFTNALKEIGYQGVRSGDLVIHAMDAFAGAVGVSDSDGKCSPVYSICEPRDSGVSSNYYGLLLRHMALAGFITSLAKGIRERSTDFRWSDASEIFFPVPSAAEQKHIIRFLDHEVGKIDSLIAEQEKMIALLKEKRQALTLHLYSEAAANGNLMRLEYLVDVMNRPVDSSEELIAIGVYNKGKGLFHKEARDADDMGESDFYFVRDGDLIISGQFAWEGSIAMAGADEDGKVVSHRYPVLKGKKDVLITEFLFSLFTTKHGDFLLNDNSRGAAGRNRPLNLASLLREKIACPAIADQLKVKELVIQENILVKELKSQRTLFEERRSALISAAVTGKIDVRGWQPPAA